MAPTKPFDNDPSAQACFMCGEPSTSRCSACAKEGGFDMFFCSQEHQKLLWPVHRRVCGKNSSPFKWPTFNDREYQAIKATMFEISHRSEEDEDRGKYMSVATRFKRDYGIREEDMHPLLMTLRKGYTGPPMVSPSVQQSMVFAIRAIEYINYGRSLGITDLSLSLQQQAEIVQSKGEPGTFDLLASYVETWLPFPRYNHHNLEAWSGLLHRWLAIVHVTSLMHWNGPATPETRELQKCGKWISNEGLAYAIKQIQRVDPEAGAGPVKEFGQWSLEYAMSN